MGNPVCGKDEYCKMLDDVSEEYCPADKYCIFKELLIAMHPSRRMIMQLRCIDKFKFERSEKEKHDIGWAIAAQLWVEEGFATAFAQAYDDKTRFRDIYRRVMRALQENNEINRTTGVK